METLICLTGVEKMLKTCLLMPCGGNVFSLGVAFVVVLPQSARLLVGFSLSVCCLLDLSVNLWVISTV